MVTSYSEKSDGSVIGVAPIVILRAVDWPRSEELQ
jgi:hypothetical protein